MIAHAQVKLLDAQVIFSSFESNRVFMRVEFDQVRRHFLRRVEQTIRWQQVPLYG